MYVGQTMSVVIRKADEADVAAILRLLAQLDTTCEPGLSVAEGTRIFRKLATYPHYAIYVAEDGDRGIVGTFAFLVMDNLAHRGAPSAIVEDVCVDETARGCGIGRKMMSFAMDLAKQAGCYKLALSTNGARTRAHDFYRSLGFSQHGLSLHVDVQGPAEAVQPAVAADGASPRR